MVKTGQSLLRSENSLVFIGVKLGLVCNGAFVFFLCILISLCICFLYLYIYFVCVCVYVILLYFNYFLLISIYIKIGKHKNTHEFILKFIILGISIV